MKETICILFMQMQRVGLHKCLKPDFIQRDSCSKSELFGMFVNGRNDRIRYILFSINNSFTNIRGRPFSFFTNHTNCNYRPVLGNLIYTNTLTICIGVEGQRPGLLIADEVLNLKFYINIIEL